MFDCKKEVREFHDDEVTLSISQRSEMRRRRDANRERLKIGLKKNNDPSSDTHQPQGSYAMRTMVQDKNNDYDIDDGVVFLKEDLEGSNGADMTALDARKMVCSALDDGSFSEPPAVLKNCVRIVYQPGYHVDVPVYRQLEDDSLELASSDWKGSSPSEVTEWYNKAVCDLSPDNGQLRLITRFLKIYKNSYPSWKSKMPSGFVISVLVVECYVPDDREDVSLYKTMKAIHSRLENNLEVSHPVRYDKLTKGLDDAQTTFLREKLSGALVSLNALFKDNCSKSEALECWKKVFDHNFWVNLANKEKGKEKNKADAKSQFGAALAFPVTQATKPYSGEKDSRFSTKMKFTKKGLNIIKKYIPNMDVSMVDGEMSGRVIFNAKYIQTKFNEWQIVPCSSDDPECVSGNFDVFITCNEGQFKAFETEKRVGKLAEKLERFGLKPHLYNDGSCCLDYSINENITIEQFVLNKVFPFFVWQAYYEKFQKCPPSGEYPHERSQAQEEFNKMVKEKDRNAPCHCGTKKLYKKCCLKKDQQQLERE